MNRDQDMTVIIDASSDEIERVAAYMNRYLVDLRLRQIGLRGQEYEECIRLLNGKAPWIDAEIQSENQES